MEAFNRNKLAFKNNQHINPETGRKIIINGPTHKKLMIKYLNKVKKSPSIPKIKSYEIHDNGGRPFVVKIINNSVTVYKYVYHSNNDKMENKLILTFKPENIWIGKSPKNKMTEFSGAYGPKYDGNTILLKLKDKYIYIGREIYSFMPILPIKTYISPMGNNDTSYPYAIDTQNNIYLMLEYVIMLKRNIQDPYDYYYDHDTIITYKGHPIKHFYIGNNESYGSYEPMASEDYDRLTQNGKLILFIIDYQNKKHILTKQNYISWMNEIGKTNQYKTLIHKIIEKRQN